MLDADRRRGRLPVADVRRAAMLAGGLGERRARGADRRRRRALARFAVALLRPLLPMLAQPAEDIADALARLGTAALE